MTSPSGDAGDRAYNTYLDAVRREIDATPELMRGDIHETHAITRALIEIAEVAAVENELATGGTADAAGLTAPPPDPDPDQTAVRTAVWRGTRYESTGGDRHALLDDAAALLLGTPWDRSRWRQVPTGGPGAEQRATRGRVRRTPILDPDNADRQPTGTEQDSVSEAMRTTDLFVLTDMNTDTTSEIYRFNHDRDEDGNDPNRGYTRVPTGPLLSELVGVLNTMVCRDSF